MEDSEPILVAIGQRLRAQQQRVAAAGGTHPRDPPQRPLPPRAMTPFQRHQWSASKAIRDMRSRGQRQRHDASATNSAKVEAGVGTVARPGTAVQFCSMLHTQWNTTAERQQQRELAAAADSVAELIRGVGPWR